MNPSANEPDCGTGDSGGAHEAAADAGSLEERIITALKTCYDPEIPVDIYELGLIYGIDIQEENKVVIDMTLTSPACPVAGSLPGEVEQIVAAVDGVDGCQVGLVWDPPWTAERMTEAARLQLGML
ncbi:MAG TPA: SUF system Fe-S cluster assembly protein [Planctomycetes bacterium]|nr:SUF system Fe-S cluster assembly protein [Planctomycetota bacterium]